MTNQSKVKLLSSKRLLKYRNMPFLNRILVMIYLNNKIFLKVFLCSLILILFIEVKGSIILSGQMEPPCLHHHHHLFATRETRAAVDVGTREAFWRRESARGWTFRGARATRREGFRNAFFVLCLRFFSVTRRDKLGGTASTLEYICNSTLAAK